VVYNGIQSDEVDVSLSDYAVAISEIALVIGGRCKRKIWAHVAHLREHSILRSQPLGIDIVISYDRYYEPCIELRGYFQAVVPPLAQSLTASLIGEIARHEESVHC
jgi:hypothetical protein